MSVAKLLPLNQGLSVSPNSPSAPSPRSKAAKPAVITPLQLWIDLTVLAAVALVALTRPLHLW
jgi:hypothetical protein